MLGFRGTFAPQVSPPVNDQALQTLLQQLTDQLGRGPATAWTDYDFEHLSDEIFTATDTRLSVTTLKRVWGRLKYESQPSTTTLNALAGYAGHTDWRDFEQSNNQGEAAGAEESKEEQGDGDTGDAEKPLEWPAANFLKLNLGLLTLLAITVTTVVLLLEKTGHGPTEINPNDYQFALNKVRATGVPNTVVFRYDATAAGDDLPVRISQSWDTARSQVVDYRDSILSSQYYYPGHYNAKLLVGDRVVRHQDLHITDADWVVAVHREPRPVYLKPEEVERGDTLVVTEATLAKYNVSLKPELPEIRLQKVPDLPPIRTDDFQFSTTLRSDYAAGSGACQAVEVLLLCKNSAIIVPLRARGCTGEARLYVPGKALDARSSDLSGFGVDLSAWTTLDITGQDKELRFTVNGSPAATVVSPVDPVEIVGVSIRLYGIGRVGETTLAGGEYAVRL